MEIVSGLQTNDSNTTNSSNNLTIQETDIQTIYEASQWLWKIISPLLLCVGLVGNIGILITLHRLKFWRNQTYTYLYILAITNTLVLMFGLPRHWAIAVFHVDIRDKTGSAGCIIQLFVIYFSMHLSSWTLVCVTTIRFLKTKFPFRFRSRYFSRKTILGYVITVLVCIGLDFHFFFTNGIVLDDDQYICSNTNQKYYTFEEKYFVVIDLMFLSFIPFTIMLVMNIFIGLKVFKAIAFRRTSIHNQESLRRVNRRSTVVTKMLFFTSIYFLLTTLPISVVNILHSFLTSKLSLRGQASLELARTIFYLFQFSYYASNFYIFIEVNKEFRSFIPCCSNRTISRARSGSTNTESMNWNSLPSVKQNPSDKTDYNLELYGLPKYNTNELSATCQTIPESSGYYREDEFEFRHEASSQYSNADTNSVSENGTPTNTVLSQTPEPEHLQDNEEFILTFPPLVFRNDMICNKEIKIMTKVTQMSKSDGSHDFIDNEKSHTNNRDSEINKDKTQASDNSKRSHSCYNIVNKFNETSERSFRVCVTVDVHINGIQQSQLNNEGSESEQTMVTKM